jgi:hypothetical protein
MNRFEPCSVSWIYRPVPLVSMAGRRVNLWRPSTCYSRLGTQGMWQDPLAVSIGWKQ